MPKTCHPKPRPIIGLLVIWVVASAAWISPATAQQYSQPNAQATPSESPPQTAASPTASSGAPAVIARGFPALSQRTRATTKPNEEPPAKENQLAVPGFTVASSLAVVLGLFAGFVWLTRRFGSGGSSHGVIPKEVVQNLGSTSIDSRTKVSMIRCGSRIIVVAQTATGIHPLSEITDPNEVQQLTASCIGDSKRNFASTLREFEHEPVEKGFVGTPPESPESPRSRGRLFASA